MKTIGDPCRILKNMERFSKNKSLRIYIHKNKTSGRGGAEFFQVDRQTESQTVRPREKETETDRQSWLKL
jgi:hypothetical protein